jgi:hypothetical protein
MLLQEAAERSFPGFGRGAILSRPQTWAQQACAPTIFLQK